MTTLQTCELFTFAPARDRERPGIGKLIGWKRACAVFMLCAAAAIASPAQTFTSLFSFDGTDGSDPYLMSFLGLNGNYYGTTNAGGAYGYGAVSSITAQGVETTLYSFCSQANCADGAQPQAGLVQGIDGNFYGTTYAGGTYGNGTIFQITPGDTLTTLYSFGSQSNDGANPLAGLIQAIDGNFYGTASEGGAHGGGTVFELSFDNGTWTETVLYSFCAQGYPCNDGVSPYAGVVQGTDGNFYGTTSQFGVYGGGTVFQLIPGGTLNTLYNFCSKGGENCTDGDYPTAALVQAIDGNFYGTTYDGGANGFGTAFQITTGGALTTLYSFCSGGGGTCSDGAFPSAGLIQGTDGNFYGTTYYGGGTYGDNGTAFELTSGGTLTTLYTFCSQGGAACTDGSEPLGGLFQDTDGTFYGTTSIGGAYNDGTVFSLATGLGPFVEPQPAAGKVETEVIVRGTNLTGASSVNFNGTKSTFTVVSGSEITTTVPAGATTGPVSVVTPSGTLYSNKNFIVNSGATVTFSPASLNFGNQVVYTTSAAKTVTVANTGSVTLDISDIVASANFAISKNTCGATLAAGKKCKVSVTFTPTELGPLTGKLTFTDNAPNSPQSVALSGTGIQPTTLTPASARYGKQKVGTTSKSKTFTLTNNQTETLTGIAISTAGDFTVSATTCGTSLAAKAKCTIGVTFTPTETGTRTGELSVSDSASNSPQTASLTGTGD